MKYTEVKQRIEENIRAVREYLSSYMEDYNTDSVDELYSKILATEGTAEFEAGVLCGLKIGLDCLNKGGLK